MSNQLQNPDGWENSRHTSGTKLAVMSIKVLRDCNTIVSPSRASYSIGPSYEVDSAIFNIMRALPQTPKTVLTLLNLHIKFLHHSFRCLAEEKVTNSS